MGIRWLIAKGWTSHSLLALEGRSAGGLLMGAVITAEPHLAHVICAEVPFVDAINTMTDPTLTYTVMEYYEWGNPAENVTWLEYIRSYDPYNNIKEVDYPNVLIQAGT